MVISEFDLEISYISSKLLEINVQIYRPNKKRESSFITQKLYLFKEGIVIALKRVATAFECIKV